MVKVVAESEQAIDEDLKKFDKFFQAIGNAKLTRYEAAAIKTYLVYKTKYEKGLDSPVPSP